MIIVDWPAWTKFSHLAVWTAALPWCFRPPGLLSILDQRPRLSPPGVWPAAPPPPPPVWPATSASASHPAKHPEQAETRAHWGESDSEIWDWVKSSQGNKKTWIKPWGLSHHTKLGVNQFAPQLSPPMSLLFISLIVFSLRANIYLHWRWLCGGFRT